MVPVLIKFKRNEDTDILGCQYFLDVELKYRYIFVYALFPILELYSTGQKYCIIPKKMEKQMKWVKVFIFFPGYFHVHRIIKT